jgi:hypothetical protein
MTRLVPGTVRQDIQDLVDQCKQPIDIRSKSHPSERVRLLGAFAKLYSGSTLTTAINNLANLLICLSFSERAVFTDTTISEAAADVGYIVTSDICTEIEDLQFLKHSPVLDTEGTYRPILNLGVYLEASGNCNGDLPGRGSIRVRAEAFQAGLIRSMYPHADYLLIDMHRTACASAVVSEKIQRMVSQITAYKVETDETYPQYQVDEVSLYRRYRLSQLQIDEFHELFGGAGFEDHANCHAIAAILQKDYNRTTKSSYREVTVHCESEFDW